MFLWRSMKPKAFAQALAELLRPRARPAKPAAETKPAPPSPSPPRK